MLKKIGLLSIVAVAAVLLSGDRIYGDGEFYVVGAGSPWKRNGTSIFFKDGNVGIGTDNPQFPLDIQSTGLDGLKVQTSFGAAIWGINNATSGNNGGIFGETYSPEGTGVEGKAWNGSGIGVMGWHFVGLGPGYGVIGATESTDANAYGVFGKGPTGGGSASGVYGIAYGNGKGVMGENTSPSGVGIYGVNSAGSGGGIGVAGEVSSGDWHSSGVFGLGTAGFGVKGRSTTGYAVFGENIATTGTYYGVVGTTTSSTGAGVHGYTGSSTGLGVYGWHTSISGVGYGVIGRSSSATGYGVYSNGNFAVVNGSKTAIVPTSQGDRKLYAQESPEVWFEDFGEGRLAGGTAQINLDPLFLETVTVNEQQPLKVFIQLKDDCNGVYVRPQSNCFEVKELRGGNSSASFTYRVVAKRKGFESARLEAAPDIMKTAALKDTKK
jgi:hypothetical protein